MPNLTELLEKFEPAAVAVDATRCLNRRHKDVGCQRCLACPTGAITAGDPLTLDAGRCVGCGLCASACPVQAFRLGGPTQRDILRSISEVPAGALEFACQRKSDPGLTRCGAAVVILLPCLARLSPATLAAAASRGAVWLDDEGCRDCPLGNVRYRYLGLVIAVNRALGLSETAPIHTYRLRQEGLANSAATALVLDPETPAYSRRDFFGALRREAARGLLGLLNRPGEANTRAAWGPGREERAFLVSLLTEAFFAGKEQDLSGLPFGRLAISAQCEACGLCAKQCPTGAVGLEKDARHFVLSFTSAECLGTACRVCQLICPAGAAKVSSPAEARELRPGATVPLLSGKLADCAVCGEKFAAREGEGLCHICRQSARPAD
ncbi:MAG: 4Fe-4S binding protein [Chloroflexota bacterium]